MMVTFVGTKVVMMGAVVIVSFAGTRVSASVSTLSFSMRLNSCMRGKAVATIIKNKSRSSIVRCYIASESPLEPQGYIDDQGSPEVFASAMLARCCNRCGVVSFVAIIARDHLSRVSPLHHQSILYLCYTEKLAKAEPLRPLIGWNLTANLAPKAPVIHPILLNRAYIYWLQAYIYEFRDVVAANRGEKSCFLFASEG
jgi:hypothetical protein